MEHGAARAEPEVFRLLSHVGEVLEFCPDICPFCASLVAMAAVQKTAVMMKDDAEEPEEEEPESEASISSHDS